MTTDKQSKAAGYKSLLQLSELSGWPVRSLQRMSKDHPKRFSTILRGAKLNSHKSREVVL